MSAPFGTGLRACSQAFIRGHEMARLVNRLFCLLLLGATLAQVCNSGLPAPCLCHAELFGG